MAKLPWFQFYPSDWFRDTRCLSLAARGAWIDILGILWDSKTRGVKTLDMSRWANELGMPLDDVTSALEELKKMRVANINIGTHGEVRIVSRRMRRDEGARELNCLRQHRLREKGGGNPLRWAAIRVHILERDRYICQYCGNSARTVDHIDPKSKGGEESEKNLVACCKKCNAIKNNRSLKECGFTLDITSPSRGHNESVTVQKSESEVRSQNQKSESELKKEKKEKKAQSRRLSDEEFMMAVKTSVAYAHVNIESECAKMDVWLLAHPGRQKTRKFLLNWLNKIERPVAPAQSVEERLARWAQKETV
jgi:5-methylcytosine-specific restriction endonuclease McrA